jgi:hypothetical protein
MATELDPRFKPTTKDVAVFIKNRTVDENNNFVGDFTPTTVVTDAEVDEIIDQSGSMVLSALRWDPLLSTIPDDNFPTVQTLIALLSAIFVELTKFSEQIARQVSPYPYLKELFDNMLSQKQGELGITPPSTGPGGSGLSLVDLIAKQSGISQFAFPDDPMVNWGTAF